MKHATVLLFVFFAIHVVSFSQARLGPTQTVLGYWPLNESTGTTVADISGYGNNGSAGATTIAAGKIGNCRQLPSSTAAGILVPNDTSLNIRGLGSAASFTLEGLLKMTGMEQSGVNIIGRAGQYALSVGSYSNAGYLQLQLWVGPTPPVVVQSDNQLPANQWVHVAGTWDGTTAKLYVNYVLVKSVAVSGTLPSVTAQVQIANFGYASPTTQAWVDELRITRGVALIPAGLITHVDAGENAGSAGIKGYSLDQNYPNPFNPSTTIRYTLSSRSDVSLAVYNALGQRVMELMKSSQDAGSHELKFDGIGLSSGVYFYRLSAGTFVQSKTMLLVR